MRRRAKTGADCPHETSWPSVSGGFLLLGDIGSICVDHVLTCIQNGGTQTADRPYGNGTLEREVVGNLQLAQMIRLLNVLMKGELPFIIENPIHTLLWKTAELKEALALKKTPKTPQSTSVCIGLSRQTLQQATRNTSGSAFVLWSRWRCLRDRSL